MKNLRNIDFTTIIIASERIILRSIVTEDAQDIFQHFDSDTTLYMYPSPAKEIGETLAFINGAITEMHEKTNIQLVITLHDSNGNPGEFIGCCGLHKLTDRTPELGIWVKKSVHGQGLGREAITALVEWVRQNSNFSELIYPVDRRNIASRKIPESLGGTIEREFPSTGIAGNELDLVEYKITIND